MAAGELDPSVAFMQGRMKTAGDPGLVLDVLAGRGFRRAEGRATRRQPTTVAPARSTRSRNEGSRRSATWSSTRPDQSISTRGAQLVGVDPGMDRDLGDPGGELEQEPFEPAAGPRRAHDHLVGEHHALLRGQAAEREPGHPFVDAVAEPERQAEVDRQLEVHVEELGPELHRAEVAGEVAHVEAPHDGPLDLGPALPPHLLEVGVLPGVLDRAREAAVAVEQARRMGERPPAVGVELGVEGEVHADVLTPVAGGGVARPRARDHQRRARRQAVAQRVVGGDVAGVGQAEVVARDDQQLGVGRVPEPLGERGHGAISVLPGLVVLASLRTRADPVVAARRRRARARRLSGRWVERRGVEHDERRTHDRSAGHRRAAAARCPPFPGSTTALQSVGPDRAGVAHRRDRRCRRLPRPGDLHAAVAGERHAARVRRRLPGPGEGPVPRR